jgi:hypothetical protein
MEVTRFIFEPNSSLLASPLAGDGGGDRWHRSPIGVREDSPRRQLHMQPSSTSSAPVAAPAGSATVAVARAPAPESASPLPKCASRRQQPAALGFQQQQQQQQQQHRADGVISSLREENAGLQARCYELEKKLMEAGIKVDAAELLMTRQHKKLVKARQAADGKVVVKPIMRDMAVSTTMWMQKDASTETKTTNLKKHSNSSISSSTTTTTSSSSSSSREHRRTRKQAPSSSSSSSSLSSSQAIMAAATVARKQNETIEKLFKRMEQLEGRLSKKDKEKARLKQQMAQLQAQEKDEGRRDRERAKSSLRLHTPAPKQVQFVDQAPLRASRTPLGARQHVNLRAAPSPAFSYPLSDFPTPQIARSQMKLTDNLKLLEHELVAFQMEQ